MTWVSDSGGDCDEQDDGDSGGDDDEQDGGDSASDGDEHENDEKIVAENIALKTLLQRICSRDCRGRKPGDERSTSSLEKGCLSKYTQHHNITIITKHHQYITKMYLNKAYGDR